MALKILFLNFLILFVLLPAIDCSGCKKTIWNIECRITNENDFRNVIMNISGEPAVRVEIYTYIKSLNEEMFHGTLWNVSDFTYSYNERSTITIEEGTFRSLTNLTGLTLAANKIERIDDDAFPENLITLNLNGNLLKAVPSESMSLLTKLENLYLKANKIETIEFEDFNQNFSSSITYISFEANELSHIASEAFKSCSSLTCLILGNNKIETIGKDAFPATLEYLYLSGNRLQNVPTESLRFSIKLSHFYLNDNMIKKIGNDDFACFGSSVKYLGLGNNEISHIGLKSFKEMGHLRSLWLQNNSIQVISPAVFPNLFLLTYNHSFLAIYENPLLCHQELLWLKEFALKNKHAYFNSTSCIASDQKQYLVSEAPMTEFYKLQKTGDQSKLNKKMNKIKCKDEPYIPTTSSTDATTFETPASSTTDTYVSIGTTIDPFKNNTSPINSSNGKLSMVFILCFPVFFI